jgi:hypothetical protein
MKVAVGYRVVTGPWGGGNRFVSALVEGLIAKGHVVVHDLRDCDIDLIVIIDPRSSIPNIPFGAGAVLRYLTYVNSKVVVLHRINECDERKNTRTMNFRLRLANYAADYTVFVGSWLQGLNVWRSGDGCGHSVILNGADPGIFNRNDHHPWSGSGAVKLVTHHWGGNWMKGFDIYERIDSMLTDETWRGRIEFTYIGNLPKDFHFSNARHLPPMDAEALAAELRKHHIYVTASINEPGGNHQNEGGLCGLPLLYRNSGCMPEYCDGFGVMYDGLRDFDAALSEIIDRYSTLQQNMVNYSRTTGETVAAYVTRMEWMYANREMISGRRRLLRDPVSFLLNQLPF